MGINEERGEWVCAVGGLIFVALFDDLKSHIVDSGVVKHYDATVGTGLDVYTHIFAKFVVAAAEVVSNGLYGCVKTIGNLMCCAVGQTVLDSTKFVESDCFSHNNVILVGYTIRVIYFYVLKVEQIADIYKYIVENLQDFLNIRIIYPCAMLVVDLNFVPYKARGVGFQTD